MTTDDISQRVEAVRRFNRFYTQQIGVLQERLLHSPFSLTEARVIYELAHSNKTTAASLASRLNLDPGYLSRILRNFKKQGLIDKQPSETDGRQNVIKLADPGQAAFREINARSHQEIEAMLSEITPQAQVRLVMAMRNIQELLGRQTDRKAPYLLRPHQPGDMGWVVYRHGVLYAQEYGWDESFEALVAEIVAKFIHNFDPKQERCWIAEKDGEIVGSVFLVKVSDGVAKLRLLYIEPEARGIGIGSRLVEECIRFTRQVGYRKITLWTNSILLAARHIYEKAGFQITDVEPYHGFGHDLVGETWELDLARIDNPRAM